MSERATVEDGAPAGPVKDGRRLRGDASRQRIVHAMLDLIREGDISPSAEAVAERAGVGLRSVFRHFENMDGLYQQINALILAEIGPIAAQPFVSADWKGRVAEMVDRRIAIFERIMPLKIAGDVHRHRSPYLASQAARTVREQRAALEAIAPAEVLENRTLLESLDLLLSFDSWRRLRRDQNLGQSQARAVLAQLIDPLLRGD